MYYSKLLLKMLSEEIKREEGNNTLPPPPKKKEKINILNTYYNYILNAILENIVLFGEVSISGNSKEICTRNGLEFLKL